MTCIVGIEINNKVLLASDGCGSDYYSKQEMDEPKLFFKNDLLFGYTSSFRFADIIKYNVDIPKNYDNVDSKQYLVTKVVPALREGLKVHGFTFVSSNRESGGTALIAYKGKVYKLQDDFSIIRNLAGYNSVGCGDSFALGSLFSTRNNLSSEFSNDLEKETEFRAKIALMAASYHSSGVSEPFHYMWNSNI